MQRFLVYLAAFCLIGGLFLCGPSTAEAGYPWGSYFGYAPGYSYYSQDYIPYYALHPPVYYSYPVPRTYGYSPFAYPPTVMTPEVSIDGVSSPAVIENPYFEEVPQDEAPSAAPSSDRSARAARPQPKLVVNPYFNGPVAQGEQPERQAGVIYPTSAR